MQKLIMPFLKQQILCGYKVPKYRAYWGYEHYGIDISGKYGGGDTTIYSSGEGEVIKTGFDNSGGNIVVVRYNNVLNRKTGKTLDVIARYFHLSKIVAKEGRKVKVGDILGYEGNTKATDYHLHLEFDTDVAYPLYSPQVSSADDKLSASQGNILKKGVDTSVNPIYLLHLAKEQSLSQPTYNPDWLNADDYDIPKLENEPNYKELYEAQVKKYENLVENLRKLI
ncbi:MAG: M23 family metallopeptidase [Oscillospiraceae bacterium]|nr:M23 family metallopeptidase [Oscillospiraceae bacterium]